MKTFCAKTFCASAVLIALLACLASFDLLEARAAYSPGSRLIAFFGSVTAPQAIMNGDDRKDYYQVDDALKADADRSALLVMKAVIDKDKLKTKKFDKIYQPLCSGEMFHDQPIIYHSDANKGWVCSSFLVAPDVIATAGHCIDMPMVNETTDRKRLSDLRFVFGFNMKNAEKALDEVKETEVYSGKRFIGCSKDTDWALVKLDRPVTNQAPVAIAGDSLTAGQSVYVIGYPFGLPLKIAANATVQQDITEAYFKADLDVFGGNSGSPVFNGSHQVIGILVKSYSGEFDYDKSQKCLLSKRCNQGGCAPSQSTRPAKFSECIANFDSPNCHKCFDWPATSP